MHLPVLKKEVLQYLAPQPNENFIDATIGQAGHTTAILQKNAPNGKVLGIELDSELYTELKLRMAEIRNRLILVNDSYVNFKRIVEKYDFKPVSGILFDLGLSSWHLEKSGRGFTFQKNEPLIMRYSCSGQTAAKIINRYSEKEIERILREYGQERFAKRLAKQIVEQRKKEPIKTTFQLVEVIKKAVPSKYQHQKTHLATRTFQALRIAVNNELENLKKGLKGALDVLVKEGRIVVISFHSGEDRLVKNFFKEQSQKGLLEILTRKPIRPSVREIQRNPRSKSAKLRAAVKYV